MDGRRRKTVHAARRPEERPKDASHSSTFTECTGDAHVAIVRRPHVRAIGHANRAYEVFRRYNQLSHQSTRVPRDRHHSKPLQFHRRLDQTFRDLLQAGLIREGDQWRLSLKGEVIWGRIESDGQLEVSNQSHGTRARPSRPRPAIKATGGTTGTPAPRAASGRGSMRSAVSIAGTLARQNSRWFRTRRPIRRSATAQADGWLQWPHG